MWTYIYIYISPAGAQYIYPSRRAAYIYIYIYRMYIYIYIYQHLRSIWGQFWHELEGSYELQWLDVESGIWSFVTRHSLGKQHVVGQFISSCLWAMLGLMGITVQYSDHSKHEQLCNQFLILHWCVHRVILLYKEEHVHIKLFFLCPLIVLPFGVACFWKFHASFLSKSNHLTTVCTSDLIPRATHGYLIASKAHLILVLLHFKTTLCYVPEQGVTMLPTRGVSLQIDKRTK